MGGGVEEPESVELAGGVEEPVGSLVGGLVEPVDPVFDAGPVDELLGIHTFTPNAPSDNMPSHAALDDEPVDEVVPVGGAVGLA